MFDSYFQGAEAKAEQKARSESMNFEQQQNAMKVNVPEERMDLMAQESRSDLIKWQQDLDDELMELVYKLRGYVIKNNQWILPDNVVPLCNERFVNDVVIPQCKPFLSRNLINSNYNEENILADLLNTTNEIVDNMSDGFDKYDIVFTNYDMVLRSIKNVIKPGIFRALHGWTKKTDSTNFKRVESSFDSPQQQQRELFKFK